MSEENTQKIEVEIRKSEDEKKKEAQKKAQVQDIAEKEMEIEDLRDENEDLKNKLGLIAEREKIKTYDSVMERAKAVIKDENELKEFEQRLKNKEGEIDPKSFDSAKYTLKLLEKGKPKGSEPRQESPSGSAPLVNQQYEIQGKTPLKFDSYEAMINYARAHANEIITTDGLTGSQVVNAAWEKAIRLIKEGRTIEGYSPDSPAKEDSKAPVQVTLRGTERNDPNSDVQKFLERANERAREKIRIARGRVVKEGENQ